MRKKTAMILTAAWVFLILAGGLFGAWYMHTHPIRGTTAAKRAELLGSGLGTLCAIGVGVIWGVWYLRRGRPGGVRPSRRRR